MASLCRMPMRSLASEALIADCGLVDGRKISEAQIAAYRRTWVAKAIVLQQELGRRAPLYEEQIAGSRFGVPPNGLRNRQLHRARPSRLATVWLDYAKRDGHWRSGVLG